MSALNGVPPIAPEEERAALGAVLLGGSGALRAIMGTGLSSADFCGDAHRLIYGAMLAVVDKRDEPDVLTVCAELDRRDQLEAVGGRAAVDLLTGAPFLAGNAASYARRVVEVARERDVRLAIAAYNESPGDDARAQLQAALAAAAGGGDAPAVSLVGAGDFIYGAEDDEDQPLWGTPEQPLWMPGEALWFVAPTGVGKTTLAVLLLCARCGVGPGEVLGMPVAPDRARRTLYVAADRPRQARRLLRLMAPPGARDALEEVLVFHRGPLPFDLAQQPDALLATCRAHGVGTLVLDSLKDLAVGLADDKVGAAVNRALQLCLAAGIEVVVLHHQRKAQAENRRPNKIGDVYGSQHLTAGAGSVVLLWGDAGDRQVDLLHLKQPAEPVGPLRVEWDRAAQGGGTAHVVDAPEPDVPAPDDLEQRVLAALAQADQPLSGTKVRELVKANKQAVLATLRDLEAQGRASSGSKGGWSLVPAAPEPAGTNGTRASGGVVPVPPALLKGDQEPPDAPEPHQPHPTDEAADRFAATFMAAWDEQEGASA